jgi:hypothetical protein
MQSSGLVENSQNIEPADALAHTFLHGGYFDASAFGGCDVPS